MSLPLEGRLTALRSRQQSAVSQSALDFWDSLQSAGVQVDPPIAGRLGVRGHSGHPFRWGEGWFEALWDFERDDDAEVFKRVQILMRLFERDRSGARLPLQDAVLQLHYAG